MKTTTYIRTAILAIAITFSVSYNALSQIILTADNSNKLSFVQSKTSEMTTAINTNLEIMEIESAISIESWMSDSNFWDSEKFSETPSEIQDWMIDTNFWESEKNIETPAEIQKWMSDTNFWKEIVKITVPSQKEIL